MQLNNFIKEIFSKEGSAKAHHEASTAFHDIFHGLAFEDYRKLRSLMRVIHYTAGEYIMHEGELSDTLFIIKAGEVEVCKKSTGDNSQQHHLSFLYRHDCFGELGLLGNSRRTASVIAIKDTDVYILKKSDLDQVKKDRPQVVEHINKNLATMLGNRVIKTTQVTVSALEKTLRAQKDRVGMGVYITYTIFLISIYTLSLGILNNLKVPIVFSSPVGLIALLSLASVCIIMMMKTGLSRRAYGFNLDNWFKNTVWSLILSVIFIAALTLIKWIVIETVPYHANTKLFYVDFHSSTPIPLMFWVSLVLYALTVPLQEIIARSALQTPLQHFLPETKHRAWLSIFISTTVFTATHAHLPLFFLASVFIPSLFWGYMFEKQKSLLGVFISHLIIGVYALYVLDFVNLIPY